MVFRFLVTAGSGVVFSYFISSGEKITVWVAEFDPVFPVLGLLVSLSFNLCGMWAAPQFFDYF